MQHWQQWDSWGWRHSREQNGEKQGQWLGEGCYSLWCCWGPILSAESKGGVNMVLLEDVVVDRPIL